ncbi:dedicator of cytokinesis protein 9-like isoform X3 [Ptychodera flava]|uniref:dedicator of cytokinesis protein 9-like isoform X3 n=1 Tax=Ptychodera flava TaxID=63121 RepID=UPI003969F3D7
MMHIVEITHSCLMLTRLIQYQSIPMKLINLMKKLKKKRHYCHRKVALKKLDIYSKHHLEARGGSKSKIPIMESYKRRYFHLKQLADRSYILEYHKEEKGKDRMTAKGMVYLDSMIEVAKNQKSRKFGIELRMQDKSIYQLAAESENDMEDWMNTFNKIIQQNNEDKHSISSSDDLLEQDDDTLPSPSKETFRESLQQSRHPELMRYAKETERYNAIRRKEGRQKLFGIYPPMQFTSRILAEDNKAEVNVYTEHFGTRFMITCEELRFKVCASLTENGEIEEHKEEDQVNVEPFYISLALYDANESRKISEDFRVDLNHPYIRQMLPHIDGKCIPNGGDSNQSSNTGSYGKPDLDKVDETWLKFPKEGVFSVAAPHSEIYLVAKIEKVLQGNISTCVEPYLKNADALKSAQKLLKQARIFCNRMGLYRMPFAWAARPIFTENGKVDRKAVFSPFYKQESAKLSDEDLIKHLKDIKVNPEKLGRLQNIPGTFKINIKPVRDSIQNCLTPSLVPIQPFPVPTVSPPCLEIEEFSPEQAKHAYPHTGYTNHLYVYPHSLKFDSQKVFTKARNIAVVVEFRDSDEESAQPLQCIRGRPGGPVFVTQASAAVLHHVTSPEFYEEVKILLPTQLTEKHHLLFTFYHISCEQSKGTVKRKDNVESPVGYAWVPILTSGRINVDEITVPVAANLVPGYLASKILGFGKQSVPEVKWLESGKPLLKVHNRVVSTVYTKDLHIHNFFSHCQKFDSNKSYDMEMCKLLKAMHAVDTFTTLQFLPVIFNQTLKILPNSTADDIQLNVVRLLIHMVTQIHNESREEALHAYVKYVFVTEKPNTMKKTVHEELVKAMAALLKPTTIDPQVVRNLMKHLWFFFGILIKSMAQYLVHNNLMSLSRNRRFPATFTFGVQNLIQIMMPHITQKYKESPKDYKKANYHLATFIKACFTYMDRGFVFKLINIYVDYFNPGDAKALLEMKFEFLKVVCSHEHFIALNLPLQSKGGQIKQFKDIDEYDNVFEDEDFTFTYSGRWRNYDLQHDYALTDEFCRNHFLVGLLLRELSCALHETKDVRKSAISVLRNLVAKHSFDDRYKTKQMQARIAALYLPFISVILENAQRLNLKDETGSAQPSQSTNGGDTPMTPDPGFNAPFIPNSRSSVSLDAPSDRFNTVPTSGKIVAQRDSSILDMIAGPSGKGMPSLISGPSPVTGSDIVSAAVRRTSLTIDGSRHTSRMFGISGSMPAISNPAPLNDNISTSHSSGPGTPNISRPFDKRMSGSNISLNSNSSTGTGEKSTAEKGEKTSTHSRTPSVGKIFISYDKLEESEVKDLLICLLYILKNLQEEILLGWWNQSTEKEQIEFFQILEICLNQFRYRGKKQITAARPKRSAADAQKSMTLPVRGRPHAFAGRALSIAGDTPTQTTTPPDTDTTYRCLLEANLASEIGVTTLDIISLFILQFKEQLDKEEGDNLLMRKVFDILLSYLQISQSESLLRHVFAVFRMFISKFQTPLFKGHAHLCGDLCYEILRCCNSKLSSTRNEACALLYLLMRSNFEFTGKKEFVRVHIQVIIAVSKIIGDNLVLNSARFQESLAIINNYANSDKAMQHTHFPLQVKDLTKKVRTVLMATSQMKEHENDPEMLVDLQYSLAKSYASTPELRKTWLESMAKIHEKHEDFSEAAHCYIHVAALVAEYLKRKDIYAKGCKAFRNISSNVESEEQGMKDDRGMHDVQYTEDDLVVLLEKCADYLEKSERYEVMGELYRLIIPFYEKRRDFQMLSIAYSTLHRVYDKVVEVMGSGKRLLGNYFRVAFFGQQHFEDDDGREYIYKEPKVTSLAEISSRLQKNYEDKFGAENVKMIKTSETVNPRDLDPKFAYIQVTFVTPYFEEKELQDRTTDFEKNNNIRRFMFETPFTTSGKAHGNPDEQCKRRTVLTTSHAFPYVKKRIIVVYQVHQTLSPIEVAIDEMKNKVVELKEIIWSDTQDMIKLQLKLQGSVSATVNAGPLAYASTFLESETKYDSFMVEELKRIFRDFVWACGKCLDINAGLIKSDQLPYHEDMKQKYKQMASKLSTILGEELGHSDSNSKGRPQSMTSNRSSISVFTQISGQSSV